MSRGHVINGSGLGFGHFVGIYVFFHLCSKSSKIFSKEKIHYFTKFEREIFENLKPFFASQSPKIILRPLSFLKTEAKMTFYFNGSKRDHKEVFVRKIALELRRILPEY